MSLINEINAKGSVTRKELEIFTVLLNPFAPHVTEEVWEKQNLGSGMVNESSWPEYDESKCVENTVEIVVQINGRVKIKMNIPVDIQKEAVLEMAKSDEKIIPLIKDKNIVKEIYVPKKLVNIVVK